MNKQCSKCLEYKSAECFSKAKQNKGGLDYYCKECKSINFKASYAKNGHKYQLAKEITVNKIEKTCNVCKSKLPIGQFAIDRTRSDGHMYQCKPCANKASVQWAKDNPERTKENYKNWRASNSSKVKEYYKKTNKRPSRIISNRLYTRLNSKLRNRIIKAGVYTPAEWDKLLDNYGRKCIACNVSEKESIYKYLNGIPIKGKLTADHIIPITKGGLGTISNIQPLCLPCNMKKSNKTIDYRMHQ